MVTTALSRFRSDIGFGVFDIHFGYDDIDYTTDDINYTTDDIRFRVAYKEQKSLQDLNCAVVVVGVRSGSPPSLLLLRLLSSFFFFSVWIFLYYLDIIRPGWLV